ncbi:MAG: hypothetical protein AAFQ82_11575, partial [Myxococcota bacterium]
MRTGWIAGVGAVVIALIALGVSFSRDGWGPPRTDRVSTLALEPGGDELDESMDGAVAFEAPSRRAGGSVGTVLSAASGEPLRGGELTLADGTAVPIGSDGRFEFTHDGPVSIVALRGPGVGDLFEGGRNRIDILEPLAGLVLHAMP